MIWGEVDLRWGITDEQVADGEVLPICLAEIRNCRPYFIGLLGERYGWVPERIDPEVLEEHPWLAEQAGRSVTELEIIDGVLGNPEMAEHAYFYFRDPAYSSGRASFMESPDSDEVKQLGMEEAQKRATARRAKLTELKNRIRASGRPVNENYADPTALGDLVLADLTALVERLFPAGSEPTPVERARALHEAFARSRSAVYIVRSGYFERLDDLATGSGPPLVVLGESGLGKSALLATWALRWRERHAQAIFGEDPAAGFVVMHFVAASPASADQAAMLRRITSELNDHFELGLEIPDEPEALRLAFTDSLYRAAAKGRVVIVIDGLNQLDERDGTLDLVWLPPVIPEGIRLVVSTLPGPALEALSVRGWPTLEVDPLSHAERRELIATYLYDEYRKKLDPEFSEQVVNAPQSANPLFLRSMLEELRLFGEHERIQTRITELLGATDVPALFDLILARFETDYARGRPGLVQESMTLIWAARHGLSEAELLELLGESGQPLPHGVWSPLYLAAKQMLVNHGGLTGFAHDYARAAVEHRYLATQESKRDVHRRLAQYFLAAYRDVPPTFAQLGHEGRFDEGLKFVQSHRVFDELPWQTAQAQDWARLAVLLGEPFFLALVSIFDFLQVRRYWASIEANAQGTLLTTYKEVIDSPESYWDIADRVGKLCAGMGYADAALRLWRSQVDALRTQAGSRDRFIECLQFLAVTLHERGDRAGARSCVEEAMTVSRTEPSQHLLGDVLLTHGAFLFADGQYEPALEQFGEAESVFRAHGDRLGIARCLNASAPIIDLRGDGATALEMFEQSASIFREFVQVDNLDVVLENLATILVRRGDLVAATAHLDEAIGILRELGDLPTLMRRLEHRGRLKLGVDARGAIADLEESRALAQRLGDRRAEADALYSLAIAAMMVEDFDAAERLVTRSTSLSSELGDATRIEKCSELARHVAEFRVAAYRNRRATEERTS